MIIADTAVLEHVHSEECECSQKHNVYALLTNDTKKELWVHNTLVTETVFYFLRAPAQVLTAVGSGLRCIFLTCLFR